VFEKKSYRMGQPSSPIGDTQCFQWIVHLV